MFVYLFFFMLVILMCLLVNMTNNIFIWWSVFVIMTMIFIMMNKFILKYNILFNYFIIQEFSGLVFLIFSFGYTQMFLLMLKIGVSPLHFWLYSVINGIEGYNLLWFLTMQKWPFVFVLLQIVNFYILGLLILGLFLCILQMFLVKSYVNLILLSSTESFSWILLGVSISVFNVLFIFGFYLFTMLIVIPVTEKISGASLLTWEQVFVFLNLPFSTNFFVKIFSLSEILKVLDLWLLVLLFLFFLSVISVSYWLISLSATFYFSLKMNSLIILMLLSLMLMLLV